MKNSGIEGLALSSLLIRGLGIGCGKSSLVSHIALKTQCPFVKIISADQLLSMTDHQKQIHIVKVFEDAYKSPISIIILDDIDRMLEIVGNESRFNAQVWNTLNVLLVKLPPNPSHKLMLLGTTSSSTSLIGIKEKFQVKDLEIPLAFLSLLEPTWEAAQHMAMPIRSALNTIRSYKQKYSPSLTDVSKLESIARLHGWQK
jgi:hypothetical protein